MDFIATYQNELLALVAILLIIVIYLTIKKKSKKEPQKEQEQEPESTKESIREEETELQEPEIKTSAPEENVDLLEGKEEGDFGITQDEPELQTKEEEKSFTKREVPPHGKIVKENFKEFSGERILLAEDNIINQKVILGLLADSGIEIVVANDGAEALEILEKDDNFTLILMDAHMPRIDGFEATRQIRANPAYNHIVVVALSGDTAADDIRKMTEAGMSEHLEKPLKMDSLYDILYAYSGSEDTNESNQSNYKELDIDEGMEISGDDASFYREILQEFLNSYTNSHELIDSYIKHNDINSADKLLLDIIGVSANIGARNLHKTATNLKTSLNSSDNEKSRLLFHFKENLENLVKEIKNYLK